MQGGTYYPYIAVIDGGFDTSTGYDQPTYVAPVNLNDDGTVRNYDVTEPSTSTLSHGTECAGILGSPANNAQGLCGVVPTARIIPLKVSGVSPSIPNAIRYSYNGTSAWVTSVSAGTVDMYGRQVPLNWSYTDRMAIAYATSRGQTVVIAAGNAGLNLGALTDNPGDDGGAVIVGSTNMNGEVASFSNYGTPVMLAAAGENLTVPYWSPNGTWGSGRGYRVVNGTSYSAPIVAGAMAMARAIIYANGGTISSGELASTTMATANMRYSPNGRVLGMYLSGRPAGSNQHIRDLNAVNLYTIVRHPSKNPVIRIFNGSDLTQWTKDDNWGNTYSQENTSYDAIWDMSVETLTSSTKVNFWTYAYPGRQHSHGYQLYRSGKWAGYEDSGGASEFKTPWGYTRATVGEDNQSLAPYPDGRWYYYQSWSARPI